MKGLLTPLRTEPARIEGAEWDGRTFRVLSNLVYQTKDKRHLCVPKGFVTDFATWLRPTGQWTEASVVHDYLYSIGADRLYADNIFKEMMTRAGCPRWRINMFYYAVRLFGWTRYKGRKDA